MCLHNISFRSKIVGMSSPDGIYSFDEIEDRINRIGNSVYGKIHFGIPFKQPHPKPDQFFFLEDIYKECRPFALARNWCDSCFDSIFGNIPTSPHMEVVSTY